jgi:DNA polymerase III gamma/tau subunit
MQAHAKSFTTSEVLRMMKAFNNAATDLRGGWQPSLSLELALAEVLDAPTEPAPQNAVSSHDGTPVQSKSKPAAVSQTESKPQPSVAGAGAPERHAVEVPAAETSEKDAVSAGEIIKAWKRMSSALPKGQANLSALMNSVRMIDVHGNTLILGLASDVLVSKIDKPDQVDVIRRLIRDEFGVEMTVRCVVTNAKGKIPPNVAQDGMVATAIQHGGEIVDM